MRGVIQAGLPVFGPVISIAAGLVAAAVALYFEPISSWLELGPGLGVIGAVTAIGLSSVAVYYFLDARSTRRELGARAEQLEFVLHNMARGLIAFDAEGRLMLWNDRYLQMYKLDPRDIRAGMHLRDLLAVKHREGMFEDDIETYIGDMSDAVARSGEGRKVLQLSDGRSVAVMRRRLPGGGWVTTHEDVTEHVELSKELKDAKRFLEGVIENIPSSVAVKNVSDGTYVLVNKAFERNTGYSRTFAIGKTAADLYSAEMTESVRHDEARAIAEDETVISERAVHDPKLGRRIKRISRTAMRDAEGRPEYFVGVTDDVTDAHGLASDLEKTKTFLQSVIENIPLNVAVKSAKDFSYLLVNRAWQQYTGYSADVAIGRNASQFYPPHMAAQIMAEDQRAVEHPSDEVIERSIDRPHDGIRRQRVFRLLTRDKAGDPEYIVTILDDVTHTRALAQQLEETKKFLTTVVDNVPVSLVVRSVKDERFLLVNRDGAEMLDWHPDKLVGKTLSDIYPGEQADNIRARDRLALERRGEVVSGIFPFQHPAKGMRMLSERRVAILDEQGDPEYLILSNEDITERRQTESRIAHMAFHDSLTNLPNRAAFLQALTQMIDACATHRTQFAVLSTDLVRFKEVNDVFGHELGDELLRRVGAALQDAAGGAVIARLSGDEFGLIVDGTQPAAGVAIAEAVSTALAQEFVIEGKALRVGATCGIAIYPRDGETPAALLANADAALHRAKVEARGSIRVFEPEMDQQTRDRRALHRDLADALKHGELLLHYQPQAEMPHKVIGFEALIRWHHPTRGFIPPGLFIPLAEESSLIVEMGEWVLREACREAASWPKPLQIAVNLSPVQFLHGDLVSSVHAILVETGLAPSRLELEITEGVLIRDFERGLSLLRRLKALGIRIAMDDFGSGYSSLAYLQSFPFDKIKIDRAFIANLGRNPQSAAIVRSVIGLGHGLQVPVVAEGVETQEQLKFLIEESCDQVQGYFIGRPGPMSRYADVVGGEAKPTLKVINS